MEELKVSMEVGDEGGEGKKGGRKARAHRDFDEKNSSSSIRSFGLDSVTLVFPL